MHDEIRRGKDAPFFEENIASLLKNCLTTDRLPFSIAPGGGNRLSTWRRRLGVVVKSESRNISLQDAKSPEDNASDNARSLKLGTCATWGSGG
jgi:hypothetical protein